MSLDLTNLNFIDEATTLRRALRRGRETASGTWWEFLGGPGALDATREPRTKYVAILGCKSESVSYFYFYFF